MKVCDTCKLNKNDDEFYKHHTKGIQPSCKICRKEYNRKDYFKKNKDKRLHQFQTWKKQNPAKVISYSTGCDVEEIEKILETNNNECEICKSKENLCVDHYHES